MISGLAGICLNVRCFLHSCLRLRPACFPRFLCGSSMALLGVMTVTLFRKESPREESGDYSAKNEPLSYNRHFLILPRALSRITPKLTNANPEIRPVQNHRVSSGLCSKTVSSGMNVRNKSPISRNTSAIILPTGSRSVTNQVTSNLSVQEAPEVVLL